MITEVQSPDFYKLLRVKPDANQKEIDCAYQKLIGKFDSSEGKKESLDKPTLKEKIEMAQEAYNTLSNKEKREAYDAVAQVKKKMESSAPVKPGPLQFMGRKGQSKNQKHQNVYQDFFGFSEKVQFLPTIILLLLSFSFCRRHLGINGKRSTLGSLTKRTFLFETTQTVFPFVNR